MKILKQGILPPDFIAEVTCCACGAELEVRVDDQVNYLFNTGKEKEEESPGVLCPCCNTLIRTDMLTFKKSPFVELKMIEEIVSQEPQPFRMKPSRHEEI